MSCQICSVNYHGRPSRGLFQFWQRSPFGKFAAKYFAVSYKPESPPLEKLLLSSRPPFFAAQLYRTLALHNPFPALRGCKSEVAIISSAGLSSPTRTQSVHLDALLNFASSSPPFQALLSLGASWDFPFTEWVSCVRGRKREVPVGLIGGRKEAVRESWLTGLR